MLMFFVGDILALLFLLLMYGAPLITLGLIIYFFLKGRETPASITDWKEENKK